MIWVLRTVLLVAVPGGLRYTQSMWLLFAPPALALDCEDLAKMVHLNVPTSIVVATVNGAGSVAPGTLACVRSSDLPAEVVAAVEAMPETPAKLPNADSDANPAKLGAPVSTPGPRPPRYPRMSAGRAARRFLYRDEAGSDYQLAHSLLEQGYVYSAEQRYVIAYERRDSWSYSALIRLNEIAEQTGDWDTVDQLLDGMSEVPPVLQHRWNLLVGIQQAEHGAQREAASALTNIQAGSASFRTGQLVYGVVLARGCIRKSVVRAFMEAANGTDVTADLGRLNIARSYFAIAAYDAAVSHYDQVPSDSPYYVMAQVEAAWGDFHRGQDMSALRRLTRSGALPKDGEPPRAFEPDASVLAALVLGDHCEYAAARHVLSQFDAWAKAPGKLRRPGGAATRLAARIAEVAAERSRLRGPLSPLALALDEKGARLKSLQAESEHEEQAWGESQLDEQIAQAHFVSRVPGQPTPEVWPR